MGTKFRGKAPLLLLVVGATVLGIVLFLHRQSAIGQKAVLLDGTELTLCAVTFGREHIVKRGTSAARILTRLPEKWVRKWKRIAALQTGTQTGHAIFGEPRLGLWFVRPGVTNAGYATDPGLLSWMITAPDGSAHGGVLNRSVGISSFPDLLPVFIDSYPRRLSEFTVELMQPVEPEAGKSNAKVVGKFLIRNPKRFYKPHWRADPLPARREDAGVECVLQSFLVIPNDAESTGNPIFPLTTESYQSRTYQLGGGGGSASGGGSLLLRDDARSVLVTFEIQDKGSPDSNWEMRQFRLSDPTGNTSFARYLDWKVLEGGRRILVCRSIPLWPDDPAWRIQLDLVRSGEVSNRVLRLLGVPLLSVAGSIQTVVQTNVFGWRLKVLAVGMPDYQASDLRCQLGPALEFDFDQQLDGRSETLSPGLQLVEVRDDSGKSISDQVQLHPDRMLAADNWRMDFPELRRSGKAGTKFLDVTLAFKEQRRFEFFVKSGWAKAGRTTVTFKNPKPSRDFE